MGRGRRQGRDAAQGAGVACRHQSRAQAQGHDAGQAFTPLGATGDGGGMEDRVPDGRGDAVTVPRGVSRSIGGKQMLRGMCVSLGLLALSADPAWCVDANSASTSAPKWDVLASCAAAYLANWQNRSS